MKKICPNCTKQFEITEADVVFYQKISPQIAEKIYKIPPPTLCPDCRQQRRLAFRNEKTLYKRKCDATGKAIISIFAPESPYKVFANDFWWSDSWDALDYGRPFDFSEAFFQQFSQLWQQVPQLAMLNSRNENSDYTNFSESEKNCYLVFTSNRNEDCFYSEYIWDSKNCADCLQTENSELCYQCVEIVRCFNCQFCQKCSNSSDLLNCYDCKQCQNCFACAGLRNKKYCILNQQYTPDEYQKIISQAKKSSLGQIATRFFGSVIDSESSDKIRKILAEYEKLKLALPRKYAEVQHCENCTGSDLRSCKNAQNCFNSFELEDAKFVENMPGGSRDIYDVSGCCRCELSYEMAGVVDAWHSSFLLYCLLPLRDSYYCVNCHSSSNLFGCIGLRNKQYCILNRQYSREGYEDLVPRIIAQMQKNGEWGKFFPMQISPFAYNETAAQDFKLLTKEEALSQGYNWRDPDNKEFQPQKVQIPTSIEATSDDITKEILICSCQSCLEHQKNDHGKNADICHRNYKIIPQELKLYRTLQVPIPSSCPQCRFRQRRTLLNPRHLRPGNCSKCQAPFQTTWPAETTETRLQIYCEQCYNNSLY